MTKEQALEIAKTFHLECEVMASIEAGCTPEEALDEWDINILDALFPRTTP